MDTRGHRKSDNFEDRGVGRGGSRRGGGLPIALLSGVVRRLGLKGTLTLVVLAGGVYMFLPQSAQQMLMSQLTGQPATSSSSAQSACELSAGHRNACDFSRVVLASTEAVWAEKFQAAQLPDYGQSVGAYAEPTLVVFSRAVSTGGCGNASSAMGPFYCPADQRLYIDPDFYGVMESKLKAPGDFAQAYVIAHEVGHHVQNLIGSSRLSVRGESKNQVSVRVELQADCLAGVWGRMAQASLSITEDDLAEALMAAHAIGDDALGHTDKSTFSHGSSKQRMRWFKRGFSGGDATACDTFTINQSAL